jgi:general secretion pathway protein A
VLIIDEAQNLSADVLEQLRLLTNLETSERKLLQIVLIGQPELRDMLAQPELEQLAQRVIARYHLDALSEAETAQYILHRLAVAGKTHGHLFDAKAVRRIHRWTRGVPRRINLLCDRALLGAYALGKDVVNREIVDKAAGEVFERPAGRHDTARSPEASSSRTRPAPLNADRGRRDHAHEGARGTAARTADAAAGGLGATLRRPPVWAWGLLAGVALPALAALALWNRPGGLPLPGKATGVAAHGASSPASPVQGASSTSAQASGAKAASALATLDAPALAQALREAPAQESTAWRELAALWQARLGEGGDPCQAAPARQLQCFRHNGGLALVRQLDRPGVLTLRNGQSPVYALITDLGQDSATLQLGSTRYRVPLAALSTVWRGDFATLWRSPPDYRRKLMEGDSGPAVDWLSARMATLHGEAVPTGTRRFDEQLKARVHAFQLAQGLTPDGVAGATTLMQLNRLTGVSEPRLGQTPTAPAAPNTGT